MNLKVWISIIILVLVAAVSISFLLKSEDLPDVYESDSMKYHTRISNDSFQLYNQGEWDPLVVKGVNMGITKPGYWPGETAISYDEYARWFKQIGGMSGNVIRIYTIHPPEFYKALLDHNKRNDDPIYVLHGVWITEERLASTLDAFLPEVLDPFQTEMKRTVDVIHGDITIEEEPGHAHGDYSYDVSPYILGWIIGIEWYYKMVDNMNYLYSDMEDYQGDYFTTELANPFEIWLAQQMEYIVEYEQDTYKWSRPTSFVNWPTTDLLTHPSEPSVIEDLVSINPNHIIPTNKLKTGYFATYHIYPYYPDFLNYEPDYLGYIDQRGESNSYAGYLDDLKASHDMPLLVGEFGVPSSRGMTHENYRGFNQGKLNEKQQGEINVHMFEDIIHLGYLGGAMFSWHDEWFKRTWNTMELDDPNRRPFWSNQQTNEQHFGLLSFDRLKIPIDGSKDQWSNAPLYQSNDNSFLNSVCVDHDEAYLYFRIDYQNSHTMKDLKILLDTIPNQGLHSIDNSTLETDLGIDFIVNISNNRDDSRVLIDSYYDPFYYQYGYRLSYLEQNEPILQSNSKYTPVHFALNREITLPSTLEVIPFSYYETGKLLIGNANPVSADYNSLTDYYLDEEKGILEVRIPWLLLNIKDPSTKRIMGNIWEENLGASLIIDDIKIAITGTTTTNYTESYPLADNKNIQSDFVRSYTWDNWNTPLYQERLKQSYYIVQEAFKNVNNVLHTNIVNNIASYYWKHQDLR